MKTHARPALLVSQISKDYGRRRVLDNVSFSVPEGEVFGFLGPNGSGKTTTIRILLGLTQATAGHCEIFGVDPQQRPAVVGREVGVVFEHPNVYERLTGRQNLQFFASLYEVGPARVEQLLAELGLEEASSQKVRQYSKGMRQRLLLCRALLHDPKLLVMDEPTSGLDPSSQEWMRKSIAAMSQRGKTVFLSTHSLEEADQMCSRIAVLHRGRLAAVDTPWKLKEHYGRRVLTFKVRPKDSPGLQTWAQQHAVRLEPLSEGLFGGELSLEEGSWPKSLEQLASVAVLAAIHSQEATLHQVFQRLTGECREGFSGPVAKE